MKNHTPIAMRCNKEQFEAIKPKLRKAGYVINAISYFEYCEFLANDFDWNKQISNIDANSNNKVKKHYEWHEEWNEKIFLEACGIEKEPTYQITKETILKYNMKDEFPDVFEVKLEPGKWYKSKIGGLWFVEEFKDNGNTQTSFGINKYGDWQDRSYTRNSEGLVKAIHQEVETALKNEAVKRYKVGDYIFDGWSKIQANIERLDKFDFSYNTLFVLNNNNSKTALFCDGIWATVIPTMSLKEAEEKLNVKIV